jgi:hypothetical protein
MSVEKICPECGATFSCHSDDGCWCNELPRVIPLTREGVLRGCLCPKCLRSRIDAELQSHS